MLPYPIETIDESKLLALIENQAAERRDLEYKRDLPARGDDGTKEFLADVTSLANAQGGDLIFGMDEHESVASELVGVEADNPDDVILRLENSIRDNVAPRLIGVRTEWIPLANGKGAVVMRVPGSLNAPHQVTFKTTRRFYTRGSKGKFEMDVHDLRQAFTQSEQLPQRFRQLHEQAIAMAQGTDMPFNLRPDPTAVVSIAPLGLFREERRVPVARDQAVVPFRAGGYSAIDTIEGVLMHTGRDPETGAVYSFALTHRSGRVDSAFPIGGLRDGHHGQELRLVWPRLFEEGLLEMARAAQNRLGQYGIEGPWVVLATVMAVQGFVVMEGHHFASEPAFRDRVLLGQLVLDRIEEEGLRPIAENLWLLFGLHRPDGPLGARA